MKRFFAKLLGVALIAWGSLILPWPSLAVETAPFWTSNFASQIFVEKGDTVDMVISASGGSNTKIECIDCTAISVTDLGNGTAKVFWNTESPTSFPVGSYVINLKAINKTDPTKFSFGVLNFGIVEPVEADLKWTSGLTSVTANYGGAFNVKVSASGGSDTRIKCDNCTLVTVTDNADGTATVFWDTSKVVGLVPGPYSINLIAESKTKPANKITGVLELVVNNPSPVEGAPQWTSLVNQVQIKSGDVSVETISASGGAATGFDCPSCVEATLQDNGDGTAKVTWDTNKNKGLAAGKYVINVRAFVKTDPAKVTLGEITYIYSINSSEPSSGGATNTPGIPGNQITAEYLKGKYGVPPGYTGPIPACAFSGTCRSTSDLVILLINIAKFLFSMIGVVAFAAFMYGGFMMIFSFGSSDKVTQGKDAMVAAVIGLVIAFGAYMIINFILNALGVGAEFRGVID